MLILCKSQDPIENNSRNCILTHDTILPPFFHKIFSSQQELLSLLAKQWVLSQLSGLGNSPVSPASFCSQWYHWCVSHVGVRLLFILENYTWGNNGEFLKFIKSYKVLVDYDLTLTSEIVIRALVYFLSGYFLLSFSLYGIKCSYFKCIIQHILTTYEYIPL